MLYLQSVSKVWYILFLLLRRSIVRYILEENDGKATPSLTTKDSMSIMTRRGERFHLVVISSALLTIAVPSISFSWNNRPAFSKWPIPATISVPKTKTACRSSTELFSDNNKNGSNGDNGSVSINGTNADEQQKEKQVDSSPLRPGSLKAATMKYGKVPYGEKSRKYRRTVYGHSDWIDHRSSDRIYSNLNNIFFSGIVRQLKESVTLVALVATALVAWNNVI